MHYGCCMMFIWGRWSSGWSCWRTIGKQGLWKSMLAKKFCSDEEKAKVWILTIKSHLGIKHPPSWFMIRTVRPIDGLTLSCNSLIVSIANICFSTFFFRLQTSDQTYNINYYLWINTLTMIIDCVSSLQW